MKIRLLCILLLPLFAHAQPFNFKSKNTVKPIELTLSWQNMGNGASVTYKGKSQPIALKIKSYKTDTSDRINGTPDEQTYVWSEIYNGKITGEYGVKVMLRSIYDMYYIRYIDQKRYDFDFVESTGAYDGKNMAFLNGVQFNFYSFYKHTLTIKYRNGNQQHIQLDEAPENRPRFCVIKDYNFDGVADVAFVFSDEQGLNEIYNIFIYDPKKQTYNRLSLPDLTEDKFTICNLKLDYQQRIFSVGYKSGPSWYIYNYKFNKNKQLVLQK